jgi:hypothetical protein
MNNFDDILGGTCPEWERVSSMSKPEPEVRKLVTREDCLDKALKNVNGDREADHGNPENNFITIARLWSVYLGTTVDPTDVSAMMVLMKVARIRSNPQHVDSWVDVAGYAACGLEVATGGK